jgi:predicted PurR-regulated permease PerM
MGTGRSDLARIALALAFLATLVGTSLWILRPFLPAMVWATMLVIATWPVMLRLQALLWKRRALAVTIMTLMLLVVFVVPLLAALDMVVSYTGQFRDWAENLATTDLPSAPAWLAGVPLIGEPAQRFWQEIVAADFHELLQRARPYAGVATQWFVSALGDLGLVLIQFLLTVLFSAVMYARGEGGGNLVFRFAHRLAGDRGERSVRLAMAAIRSVALGVVVTAIIQSIVAALGLFVAGVPYAKALAALTFVLCVAQIGPAPVLIPAVIWMYFNRDPFLPSVLLVFSAIAMTLDNVLRPILITRGAHLPLLLVLIGVIGGLLAFGLIGIFIGPTVLAVAYTLTGEWISEDEGVAVAADPSAKPELRRLD